MRNLYLLVQCGHAYKSTLSLELVVDEFHSSVLNWNCCPELRDVQYTSSWLAVKSAGKHEQNKCNIWITIKLRTHNLSSINKLRKLVQWWHSRLAFQKCPIWISARLQAILSDIFSGFPQSFQAYDMAVFEIRIYPLVIIIFPYHTTLYHIWCLNQSINNWSLLKKLRKTTKNMSG